MFFNIWSDQGEWLFHLWMLNETTGDRNNRNRAGTLALATARFSCIDSLLRIAKTEHNKFLLLES